MAILNVCLLPLQIPEELSRCRNSYVEQALIPPRMEDLLDDSHSYRSLVKDSMDALLKETKDKFKGYDTCSTPEHAELAYKKVRRLLWDWTHPPVNVENSTLIKIKQMIQ